MGQTGLRATGRRRRFLVPAIVTAAIVAAGAYGWERTRASATQAAAAATPRAAPAVPVTTATVAPSSFPIELSGLGTVQAYNTVVVRTRVDGQIQEVAYQEGQMVHAGDVLVRIDPRPYKATLDGATAKKAQDEASLANAKADLQRYTNLGSYATRQQLDTQTSTVSQQTALIAADQASIDNAQTQLDYATVRAPITGLAGFRQVDIGNIVNAATQTGIVTITQLEPISIVFTAPEDQLPSIDAALRKGEVPVAAYSSDGSRKMSDGKLETVNNQVDTASGTIRLKATFANKDHALWPGLSVTTRMLIGTLKNVLTIPDDAVQHGPNGLYTYLVDDTHRARMRKIAVAQSGGGQSVVTDGLTAGQSVVSAGQYRVQDGTLVAERQSASKEARADGK